MSEDNGEKLELIRGLAEMQGEFREFKETTKNAHNFTREELKQINAKLDGLVGGCSLAIEAQEGVKKAHGRIDTIYKVVFTAIISAILAVAGWFIKGK